MEVVIGVVYNNKFAKTPTVTNAGSVWFEIEHANKGEIIYANLDKANNLLGGPGFVNVAKINVLPTILFLEKLTTQYRIITRLTGTNLSTKEITRVYEMALNNKFSTAPGGNGNQTGLPDEGDGGLGFGLFDIGLPNIFWKGLAIYAGYKTATVKKDTTKLLYGGLTAISAIKSIKSPVIGTINPSYGKSICADGYYSTSFNKGACSWHGGIGEKLTIQEYANLRNKSDYVKTITKAKRKKLNTKLKELEELERPQIIKYTIYEKDKIKKLNYLDGKINTIKALLALPTK